MWENPLFVLSGLMKFTVTRHSYCCKLLLNYSIVRYIVTIENLLLLLKCLKQDIIKRENNGQKEQTSITQRLMSSGIPRVHYVKCYATKACNNASVTHYMSPVSLCYGESMS